MKIVNLTSEEVINILNSKESVLGKHGDNYRKYFEYDINDTIGLYWKKFLDCKDKKLLDREIEIRKEIEDHEYSWEFYEFGRLCALIDRLEGTKSECVSGIVLCNNYPVGVLFPRKLLEYKTGCELLRTDSPLTDDEKKKIFSKANECIEEAMEHDVYPENLWLGNILINPEDHNDVRLFGLDENGTVARVETKQYIEEMKKKSCDIIQRTRTRFNQLRNNDY